MRDISDSPSNQSSISNKLMKKQATESANWITGG